MTVAIASSSALAAHEQQAPALPHEAHAAREHGWGSWLRKRAAFCGMMTVKEIAARTGCEELTVVRWLGLKSPPEKFYKKNDVKLARSLQISIDMLTVGWRFHSPATAPFSDTHGPIHSESSPDCEQYLELLCRFTQWTDEHGLGFAEAMGMAVRKFMMDYPRIEGAES